jgi:hypothetical protein
MVATCTSGLQRPSRVDVYSTTVTRVRSPIGDWLVGGLERVCWSCKGHYVGGETSLEKAIGR